MTIHAIVEWNGSDLTAIHKVRVPDMSETGFYRSVTSYCAFDRRQQNRNFTVTKNASGQWLAQLKRKEGRWFTCSWWHDYEHHLTDETRKLIVEHGGIWAFYETVGYDHRRDRFINVGPAAAVTPSP